MTDLITAAANNDIASIKKLIKKGVDIDARDENGETALYIACRCRCTKTIKFLLKKGAFLHGLDKEDLITIVNCYSKKGW